MKKLIIISIILLFILSGCQKNSLPKPELEDGLRGELGIDKNINESTIDNYLNREDAVYRDMRMLQDSAKYENIGGDSYLSGFVKGFEITPYPYICNPVGLPEEVGQGYQGRALYTYKDDKYVANYEESLNIVEELFPKDKVIFLMCGGGGYAGMMRSLLIYLGYDENKIYDVGGFWYYEGNNVIEVQKGLDEVDIPNYHIIDFDSLHPANGYKPEEHIDIPYENSDVKSNKMIDVESLDELNKLQADKKTFLLYVYLPGCVDCASFKPIVEEFIDANQVNVYQLNYKVIKDSDNIIKQSVKYTPSMFIFVDGKLKAFLNPQSENDKEIYKTTENLSKWIDDYVDVEIVKTDTRNNSEGCEGTACKL